MAWNTGYRVWLTEAQSLENAQMVINHFAGTDWSGAALAALCGNMRHESSINPDMYEYGYDWSADRGYGLVQWTPRSKYWNWAVANNLPPESGDSQLARIDYEVNNNIQWIPTSEFNYMTFAEFRTNAGNWTIDYLTAAFTWSYERPNRTAGENSMPDRVAFAHRVYSELDLSGSGGGGGVTPTPKPSTNSGRVSGGIFAPPSYQTEEVVDGMTYYKVKKGDTALQIAKKFDVNVNDLLRVRFKDIGNADKLDVNEVLLVPRKASKPAPAKQEPLKYRVKSGDTLGAIARRFGTNTAYLTHINGLKDPNKIYAGQVLTVRK